jgi:hypothetical protein
MVSNECSKNATARRITGDITIYDYIKDSTEIGGGKTIAPLRLTVLNHLVNRVFNSGKKMYIIIYSQIRWYRHRSVDRLEMVEGNIFQWTNMKQPLFRI